MGLLGLRFAGKGTLVTTYAVDDQTPERRDGVEQLALLDLVFVRGADGQFAIVRGRDGYAGRQRRLHAEAGDLDISGHGRARALHLDCARHRPAYRCNGDSPRGASRGMTTLNAMSYGYRPRHRCDAASLVGAQGVC
jgi:hypothetical protein